MKNAGCQVGLTAATLTQGRSNIGGVSKGKGADSLPNSAPYTYPLSPGNAAMIADGFPPEPGLHAASARLDKGLLGYYGHVNNKVH